MEITIIITDGSRQLPRFIIDTYSEWNSIENYKMCLEYKWSIAQYEDKTYHYYILPYLVHQLKEKYGITTDIIYKIGKNIYKIYFIFHPATQNDYIKLAFMIHEYDK